MNQKDTSSIIANAEENLLHTYNRYPVVWDRGEDVYLVDTEGNRYLDFAAGIAVMALGYSNEEYKDALKNQIDKVTHVSNLFYTKPVADAAERLKKISGMDRVFFTNSGAEAIEGAIKSARKWAFARDGHTDHEIVAMQHSFHGRTMGALSVTGTEKYRAPFEPLIPGIRFADFNDIESVKAVVNEKTCAILVEAVQGEGGIYPATPEFMEGLDQLRKEHDLLLIFDEIQCGMGRCGQYFAWQHYGIRPDIMTSAKGLGCGVPVGAFLMTERVAELSLKPGDHGTTYGGNPFVCAAVDKVIEIMEREDIPGHVREVSAYLTERLQALAEEKDSIKDVRGLGLFCGLELSVPVGDVVTKAREKGLIVITAGSNVLRLVPPLVIEKKHVDEMIAKLSECL